MGLSSHRTGIVSGKLVGAEASRRALATVRVIMLKDGRGITSHGRRPALVEPSKGSVLEVSGDLADNWGGAGYCEPYVEPPAELPAPSLAAKVRTDVPERAAAAAVKDETSQPTVDAQAKPRSKPKGRRKSRR